MSQGHQRQHENKDILVGDVDWVVSVLTVIAKQEEWNEQQTKSHGPNQILHVWPFNVVGNNVSNSCTNVEVQKGNDWDIKLL